MFRGVRTKILWMVVAALAVANWLPIIVDQFVPGSVPAALAAVFGPYDVSNGIIGAGPTGNAGGVLFTKLTNASGLSDLKATVQAIDDSSITDPKGPNMKVHVSWDNLVKSGDDIIKVTALAPGGFTITPNATCTAQFKLKSFTVFAQQGDSTTQVSGNQAQAGIPPGKTSADLTIPINDTTFPPGNALQTFQIKVTTFYSYFQMDPTQTDSSCSSVVDATIRSYQNWNFTMASDAQALTLDHQGRIQATSKDPNFNPSKTKKVCGGDTGEENPFNQTTEILWWIPCQLYVSIVGGMKYFFNQLLTPFIGWITAKSAIADQLTKTNATAPFNPSASSHWAADVYAIALNLVNYVIILALLFLSFVNILHINIDTYGIKKIMPSLVYGVILANFSLFITRLIVDVADVMVLTISQQASVGKSLTDFTFGIISTAGGTGFLAALLSGGTLIPIAVIALIIASLIPFLLVSALGLLFYVRYYIVILLAAVSPLAFIAMTLPMTQSYFKQWWDNLLKWVFMAPIAWFFLYLMSIINLPGIEGWFMKCALIYAALQVPFQLGGTVMNNWGGLLKKAGMSAAKTGDKWLGDATKKWAGGRPMNFQGLYQGWKERNEEREHEQLGEAKAFGRAGSEAWSRGWSALINKQNPMKGSKESFDLEMSRSQNLVVQNKRKKAEENFQAFEGLKDDQTLVKELKEAINSGDYEAAETYMMVAARRGILSEQDQRSFIKNFQQGHQAEVQALDSLIPELNRKAESPEELRTSLLHMKDGKVVNKDDAQIKKDRLKEIDKFASSRGRTATQTFVKNLMVKEKLVDAQGRPADLDSLSADQRALFAHLRGLGKYNLDEGSQEVLFRVKPDVQFKPEDFNFGANIPANQQAAIQQAIGRHLNQAGSLGGLQFQNPEERRAAAQDIHANYKEIAATLRQKSQTLVQALPDEVQAKIKQGKPQNYDQLKTLLTADDHLKIQQKEGAADALAQLGQLHQAGQELKKLRDEHEQHVPRQALDALHNLSAVESGPSSSITFDSQAIPPPQP